MNGMVMNAVRAHERIKYPNAREKVVRGGGGHFKSPLKSEILYHITTIKMELLILSPSYGVSR